MKKSDLFKFHLKDARDLTKVIHSNIVDVTITSPPYGSLKNYGDFEGQIGYKQKYEEEYLTDLQNIFKDIFDVTKDTGSLWIIVNTFKERGKFRLLPFNLTNRLEEVGWKLRDIIIWDKTKTLPWSRKGQLRNTFEYILFLTKTKKFKYYIKKIKKFEFQEWWIKYPERYNPQGKTPTNIWIFPIPTQGSWSNGYIRHFCPFPSELVERILLLTTDEGDVVLDPFAGSGIVLAQAECMRRKYVGFDLKKEYIQMFRKDIRPEMKFWWSQRRQHIEALEEGRGTLEDTIKKLRQVKFPKTVIKELLRQKPAWAHDGFPVNTVFAISNRSPTKTNNERHKFMKETLYLVFEHEIDKGQVITDLNEILRRPPLSKYGILAEVKIVTRKAFAKMREVRTSLVNQQLWLYANGIMHKYSRGITIKDWFHLSGTPTWRSYYGNNVPPVISNIEVYQPVRRT